MKRFARLRRFSMKPDVLKMEGAVEMRESVQIRWGIRYACSYQVSMAFVDMSVDQ
jgi:hypothetical protein